MTMQVSKGEFDRRVKLLEQKVKESTSSLIARLQAESEAFIEKLRNTQLDIDSLRNEIDGTETDLDDLVTSFNNYKANMLRIDSAFDANGQFDGTRIMPLSVETAALSVGQRSQQLTLSGIKFEVKNYDVNGSNFNESSPEVWESGRGKLTYTSGSLFHYGFGTEADGPKIYTISSGNKIMTTTNAYYIYAKLPKTNNSTATIDIDTRQITVEGKSGSTIVDSNNYYIQLGYISSEMQSPNGIFKNTRKVDMTYGTTTINGRLITTGRIEGNSGVFIDLDNGEFGGGINKITVGSGSSTIGLKKGESSNIALWAGSQNPATNSPIYIKTNGEAKFGYLKINSNGSVNSLTSSLNTGNFQLNTDGSAKFGDLDIASNGILSFKDSNLKIQKSNFIYSNLVSIDQYTSSSNIYSNDNYNSYYYQYTYENPSGYSVAISDPSNAKIVSAKIKFQINYSISANTKVKLYFVVKTLGSDHITSTETQDFTNSSSSVVRSTYNVDVYITFNPYIDRSGINKLDFIISQENIYGSGNLTIQTISINRVLQNTLNIKANKGFNIFNNGYTVYNEASNNILVCGIDSSNIIFKKISYTISNAVITKTETNLLNQ